MATQDTTVTDENGEDVNKEVETTQVEDENLGADELNKEVTDTGTENENVEDEDGKTETEDEDEDKFQKRFTQFGGDTPEEYLKNLEEAYANSSTEGQRNSKEAKEAKEKLDKILTAVANNPELAKTLADVDNAPAKKEDPALVYARQQMEQQYEKDWGEFTSLHPELVGNQALTDELIDEMDAIAYAAERRGKTLTMAEGLNKAWISLGKQAADDKEKIVNKTKEQASKPAPGASKPKQNSGKETFTPEQIAVAKKMGVSAEDLAKYSNK